MDARPETLQHARYLRKHMTRSEVVLWQALRGGRLDGHRIRRQHPLGPFVLDFFCSSARLAIEVDGGSHDADHRGAQDHGRDQNLLRQGVRTLRVDAGAVLNDLDSVLDEIRCWVARGANS